MGTDYINRADVLTAIMGEFPDAHYPSWYAQKIKEIPAADVAPVVHGKWCWEGKFKACSECGSYVEWNETLGANFWKFCPYCGTKMDGKCADNAEHCVCCGEVIPEGRQVCPACEAGDVRT